MSKLTSHGPTRIDKHGPAVARVYIHVYYIGVHMQCTRACVSMAEENKYPHRRLCAQV